MTALRRLGILILICTLVGCSYSPLLNHTNEADPDRPIENRSANGCELYFANSKLCMTLNWENGPTSSGESQLLLTPDVSSLYVPSLGEISLELWMPEHGHGSSPVMIEKTADNRIRITDIWFIMPGFWQLRFILTHPNGESESATVGVRL